MNFHLHQMAMVCLSRSKQKKKTEIKTLCSITELTVIHVQSELHQLLSCQTFQLHTSLSNYSALKTHPDSFQMISKSYIF
uniref:Uncharacterized protein n=1 Tax=Anguilla anguilla TaxID=7936 RepID=A0A0E9X3X1_ANGAN